MRLGWPDVPWFNRLRHQQVTQIAGDIAAALPSSFGTMMTGARARR
jgi:hypothetical protein